MISFVPSPERIVNGETLKVKLDIDGQSNTKTYKGTYFNVVIKKNGGTHGTVTLYPLRYNSCPLEWEINPYSYGSEGTFIVNCIFQGSSKVLTSTTFIVEPNWESGYNTSTGVNIHNNLTTLEQAKRLKCSQVKKQEVPIDGTAGCQVQKPNETLYEQEHILLKDNIRNKEHPSELISTSKVQKAYRNC